MNVELRRINWDNYKELLKLEVKEFQEKYVAPVQFGFIEAYLNQEHCKTEILGIYGDGVMAGYAVIQFWKNDVGAWYDIHRFMLDWHFQGNGLGSEAFKKIMEYVETSPMGTGSHAVIEFMPENKKAAHIYHKYGFTDTDEFNQHGEQKAVFDL